MALPQAVQQAADNAEALQAQLYAVETAAPEDQPAPTEPVAEATPPVAEPPRQAEPAPAETPRPAEPAEDAAYWKQRFTTLQGKFTAEVPQLHQQLREQGIQLAKLTEMLEVREKTPPQPDAQDSNDEEEYGPAWVATVDRRAGAIAARMVAMELTKLRAELGVVQQQVGQVTKRVEVTDADRFWGEVMTLVPDWKALDTSPEWIEWLNTTPEFSEDTYRDMATKAVQKWDAQKIAGLVKLYRSHTTPPAPAPEPVPPTNSELLRQVAPSTTRASAPAPQTGKLWTGAEYQAAMDVRNTTRYGKAEADRLEAEANLAVAEGRVRWG